MRSPKIKITIPRRALKNPAILVLVVLLAALGYIEAPPQQVSHAGHAYAIDGDTIDIQGRRFRLFGIDAPESAQTCAKDGKDYSCGKDAGAALSALIGQQPVTCEKRDIDPYKRIVAICYVGDIEINRWLVRNGYAVAYRHYSDLYVEDEAAAKAARAGIWAGSFQEPWDYRRNNR